MELEAVDRVLDRLVGAAKSEQIGRHDPVPGAGKHRDHAAIEVRPRRLAMQAQEGVFRARRAFVEPMHAQAGKTRQRFGKMRPERKSRKIRESILRRSQGVHVTLPFPVGRSISDKARRGPIMPHARTMTESSRTRRPDRRPHQDGSASRFQSGTDAGRGRLAARKRGVSGRSPSSRA